MFPARKIPVLNGQFGKRRFFALRKRIAERDEFRQEHVIGGDAIEDDLMHRHEQAVVFISEPHQRGSPEWTFPEIERQRRFAGCEFCRARFAFAFGDAAQVYERQFQALGNGLHNLHRPAIHHVEGGAPHLVPPENLEQAPLQNTGIQRPAPPQGHRLVVDRKVGSELCVHPDLLLRRRKRSGRFGLAPWDSVRGWCAGASLQVFLQQLTFGV
jgi:hypothetical protein